MLTWKTYKGRKLGQKDQQCYKDKLSNVDEVRKRLFECMDKIIYGENLFFKGDHFLCSLIFYWIVNFVMLRDQRISYISFHAFGNFVYPIPYAYSRFCIWILNYTLTFQIPLILSIRELYTHTHTHIYINISKVGFCP